MLLGGCSTPGTQRFEEAGGAAAASTTSGEGGSAGGPICSGACYLWKSALFDDLSMFSIGPPGAAPPCPESAPAVGARLHADLKSTPHTCPVCSCSPAGCVLPEDMHVAAGKCVDGEEASLSWTSLAWEGNCTAEGAIAPGLLCGGEPCTQSLTITAPTVKPCAPVSNGLETKPDPVWGQTAQECILGPLGGEGCRGSEACLQPPPEGFSLCLYRWGDGLTPEHCPEEYPRHLVMYADQEDTRACEPCACSEPQGAECSALVSVFADGACGALLGAVPVSTAVDESCLDLLPGAGLGSKTGAFIVDQPGSCAPSGGEVGSLTPTVPITLCCQPQPDEVP